MRGGGGGIIAGFGRFAGGGFGDWNSDGMDDHMEFEEYSWGKQNWRNNGGSNHAWQRVWDGILAQQGVNRQVLMTQSFWGQLRAHKGENSSTWDAFTCDRKSCTVDNKAYRFGDIVLNTNRLTVETSGVWRGMEQTTFTDPALMGYVLAHEVYHLGRCQAVGLSCHEMYRIDADAEEARAANYANRTFGWPLEAFLPVLPKP